MEDHDELTQDELVQLIESRFKEYLYKRPDPNQILSLYTSLARLIEQYWWDQWSEQGIQQAVEEGGITDEQADELREGLKK